jgi:transketolase
MKEAQLCAMRNVMIDEICAQMGRDEAIYFLSADFGAPALDHLRDHFPDRFTSVGIAEQNLIGVATGLALEGFKVFAYGIAPFVAMRDYEQIRIHLAMLSQTRPINVNLIAVGAGISYDMSGPTHHCIEDLSILRTLPNVDLFSPSDWVQAQQFVDYALQHSRPKYIRLEGKVVPPLYPEHQRVPFEQGFCELVSGKRVCMVTTGFPTIKALELVHSFNNQGANLGLVDVFMLRPIQAALLASTLSKYQHIFTVEEAFKGKGGLDSLILHVVNEQALSVKVTCWGFQDKYFFDNGGRTYLHQLYGIGEETIIKALKDCLAACRT